MPDSKTEDRGVLKDGIHDRLWENLSFFSKQSGVPRKYLLSSMQDVCGEQETAWVRAYDANEGGGLYYLGKLTPSPQERMWAVAGAFIRNIIDARVLTVPILCSMLREELPSLILLPDFVAKRAGWEVAKLWSRLSECLSDCRKVVVALPNLEVLSSSYRPEFRDFVVAHYLRAIV